MLRRALATGSVAAFASLLTVVPAAGAVAQKPPAAAFEKARRHAAATGAQAMLVMWRGEIVFEEYMAGGSRDSRQRMASISKSITGLATVAAVADGKIELDAPVSRYLPEWSGDTRKSQITVRQLLSLESGLESGASGTGCGEGRATWNDAMSAPSLAKPGAEFSYGPYPFSIMGMVLERVLDGEKFEHYLDRRIGLPLGIKVAWPLRCSDGKPSLAGGAAMTARDLASIGEMVRLGGVFKGKRILPDSIIAQLFVPAHSNKDYGMSWWLAGATGNPAAGERQAGASVRRDPVPSWLPRDLVMAAGMGKQRLYIIPSRELVIVRLGPINRGALFRDLNFLKPLIAPSAR